MDTSARLGRMGTTCTVRSRQTRSTGGQQYDVTIHLPPSAPNGHTIAIKTVRSLRRHGARWAPSRWSRLCRPLPTRFLLPSPTGVNILEPPESLELLHLFCTRKNYWGKTQGKLWKERFKLNTGKWFQMIAITYEYSKPQKYLPKAINETSKRNGQVRSW